MFENDIHLVNYEISCCKIALDSCYSRFKFLVNVRSVINHFLAIFTHACKIVIQLNLVDEKNPFAAGFSIVRENVQKPKSEEAKLCI